MKTSILMISAVALFVSTLAAPASAWIGPVPCKRNLRESLSDARAVLIGEVEPEFANYEEPFLSGNTGYPYRTAKFKIEKVLFCDSGSVAKKASSGTLSFEWFGAWHAGRRAIVVMDDSPFALTALPMSQSAEGVAPDLHNPYELQQTLVQILIRELETAKSYEDQKNLLREVSPLLSLSEALALLPLMHSKSFLAKGEALEVIYGAWSKFSEGAGQP